MLKIVTAPHPKLSQKAKRVIKIDKHTLRLIHNMKQALDSARNPIGIGLAAPQVGYSLQVVIIKPTPKSDVQTFINPKIDAKIKTNHLTIQRDRVNKLNKTIEEKSSTKLEGCLSLPNIWGGVERDPIITTSYLDEKGKPHTRKFTGFIATIIQHEMDHLEGILFPKRVLEQKGKLYKSRKDEKGKDVFEEIEI